MRWTGLVVLGLVAIIVAGYVAKGVIGAIRVARAKDDARETVRQLERDTGDVNQHVATHRKTLGAPLQSWSQVVCEQTPIEPSGCGTSINGSTSRTGLGLRLHLSHTADVGRPGSPRIDDYTVVRVSGPHAGTDLGCSPWGIIFCGKPIDRPAMPE